MALYFLDTSALVKLYVQEAGTDRLLRLASDRQSQFAVLAISVVEARSAIRRRQRDGDIAPTSAEFIITSLQGHLETRFIQQAVNAAVIETAMEMIDRYALRAYDAMQLGGCAVLRDVELQPLTFVCSDHKLLEAALSEKIQVLDPAT